MTNLVTELEERINQLGTLNDNWIHLRELLKDIVSLIPNVPQTDLDLKKKGKK